MMRLKLMVDRKRNKVVYAEAKKDFVDLLIYLLSLPLTAVVKYLTSAATTTVAPPPSSLANLHRSIESIMKAGYIKPPHDDKRWTGHSSILVPHLLTHVPVLPRLSSTRFTYKIRKLYGCRNSHPHVSDVKSTRCKYCGCVMDHDVDFTEYSSLTTTNADYVKEMVPFMVSDDLSVSPLDSASVIVALKGCEDGDMVEKEVQLGFSEVVELLNASLHSATPLTSVFLKPTNETVDLVNRLASHNLIARG